MLTYLKPSQEWPRHLLTGLLMLALFLPFASLPPFHLGMWFQSEPINVALYGISALLALVMAHPCFHAQILRIWKHPAVWACGAMFLWTLVMAPFTEFPIKSIQGNPETGQGGFWFLALFVWMTAYILAANTPLKRLMVLGTLLFVTIVIFILQNLQGNADWFVVKWPDFQAFIGIFAFITIMAKIGHRGIKVWAGAYLIGALLVYISDSRAAYLCYFGMLPALAAMFWFILNGKYAFLGWFRRHINAVAAFIMVFGAVFYVLLSFPSENYYSRDFTDATQLGEAEFNFYYSSVGTRILFNKIALEGMWAEPTSFLTGIGWGHYANTLFRHTFVDNVSATALFDKYGHDAPNWFMVFGTAFHSHNSHMEALHATGIVGLALSFLFFVKVMPRITNMQRALIAAGWISIATLFSVWFLLAIVTIYFAIAAAFTVQMDLDYPIEKTQKYYWPILSVVLLVATLMLAATTYAQYDLAARGKAYSDAVQSYTPDIVGEMGHDYGQGGHHLWWIAASLVDYIDQKRNHNILAKPANEPYAKIVAANQKRMDELGPQIEAKQKALANASGAKQMALQKELEDLQATFDGHKVARDEAQGQMQEIKEISQADVLWYMNLMHQVEKWVLTNRGNTKLRQLLVEAYNRLHERSPEPIWDGAKITTEHKWPAILWWYALNEPYRLDILHPYYRYYTEKLPQLSDPVQIQEEMNKLGRLLDPVIAQYPNDPTANWFMGMALQYVTGKNAEAFERMNNALDGRVERYFRIWPSTYDAVRKAREAATPAKVGDIENAPKDAQ